MPATHNRSIESPQFGVADRVRTIPPRLRLWSRVVFERAGREFGRYVALGRSALRKSEAMDQAASDAVDVRMMRRCIELSKQAGKSGEFPFAAVICRDGAVIAETTNQVAHDRDVTRHAEIMAISEAQRAIANSNLQGCTLYTSVEPCPMCSFPIRETRISRVVYAISSPLMGGASRWDVLGDPALSIRMPEAFGPPPEVVPGFLSQEAASVWRRWNPIVWGIIRLRGVFAPA